MSERTFDVIDTGRGLIKAWTRGVAFEPTAEQQLRNVASLPFVYKWVAAMPDVHAGVGATVGSVIPTEGAVIPAAVGVDIGCGMMASRTSLTRSDLPAELKSLRQTIEGLVPHGRTEDGRPGDKGAWEAPPEDVREAWAPLQNTYDELVRKHPAVGRNAHPLTHLGTLGTGNHFIEVCLDLEDRVWIMLHSGSRGVGGRIGNHFINLAKRENVRWFVPLPDPNLAYLPEDTDLCQDYLVAAEWAQRYAMANREVMMARVVQALRALPGLPDFEVGVEQVNCHHNYVAREYHFGKNVFVTRKGAVRARAGELGIIPGSMGARSYIVRGLGNADAFHSCSHGAGRAMTRTAAFKTFTLEDHARATEGIECRKDAEVLDETPMAYKPIDAVMEAQKDLVEVKHTLRQVLCIKG